MFVSITEVQELAFHYFQLQGQIKQLSGEIDLNYLIESADGKRYCFKVAHAQSNVPELEFQNAMMEHLQAAGLGLEIPVPLRSVQGPTIVHHHFPGGELRYLAL